MAPLTMSRLQCADCGAEAVEKYGVVQPCRCGSPSRKFEVDREGTEDALRHRAAKLEAALRAVVKASAGGEYPWRLTLALHEAALVLAGEDA